jgi:hypothetical protein
MDMDV